MQCWALLVVAVLGAAIAQDSIPDFARVPGVPGKDYPVHAEIPETHFSCRKHPFLGYYADVDTGCQVYHLCEEGGKQSSFLCPNGTIFNQLLGVCDEWYHVDCLLTPQLFWRNKYSDQEVSRKNNKPNDGAFLSTTKKSVGDTGGHQHKNHTEIEPPGQLEKLKKQSRNDSQNVHHNLTNNDVVENRKENTTHTNAERRDRDKKKGLYRKLSSAEKIFLVLNFIEKMKSTLSPRTSTTNDTKQRNSNIWKKLVKILAVFEATHNYDDAKEEITNNLMSNFNEEKIQGALKQYAHMNNVKDSVFFNKVSEIGDKNTHDTADNFETDNKDENISDEAAIDVIQRILDIAKRTHKNHKRKNIDTMNRNNSIHEPSPLSKIQSHGDGYHKNINEIINQDRNPHRVDTDNRIHNIDILNFRSMNTSHGNFMKNYTTGKNDTDDGSIMKTQHNVANDEDKSSRIVNNDVDVNYGGSISDALGHTNHGLHKDDLDAEKRREKTVTETGNGLVANTSYESGDANKGNSSMLRDATENPKSKSASGDSDSSDVSERPSSSNSDEAGKGNSTLALESDSEETGEENVNSVLENDSDGTKEEITTRSLENVIEKTRVENATPAFGSDIGENTARTLNKKASEETGKKSATPTFENASIGTKEENTTPSIKSASLETGEEKISPGFKSTIIETGEENIAPAFESTSLEAGNENIPALESASIETGEESTTPAFKITSFETGKENTTPALATDTVENTTNALQSEGEANSDDNTNLLLQPYLGTKNNTKSNDSAHQLVQHFANESNSKTDDDESDTFKHHFGKLRTADHETLPNTEARVHNDTGYEISGSSIVNSKSEPELDGRHLRESESTDDQGSLTKPNNAVHTNTDDSNLTTTTNEIPFKNDSRSTAKYNSIYSDLSKALLEDDEIENLGIEDSDELDDNISESLIDVLKGIYETMRR